MNSANIGTVNETQIYLMKSTHTSLTYEGRLKLMERHVVRRKWVKIVKNSKYILECQCGYRFACLFFLSDIGIEVKEEYFEMGNENVFGKL